MTTLPIEWTGRDRPLTPAAVVGRGPAAAALGRRLLALDDECLGALRGVAGRGLLIAIGDEESLPWVDGVAYLGHDPAGPSLLVPTAVAPSVPLALIERALLDRPDAAAPLALLAAPLLVVSLAGARAVSRATLENWLASET